MHASDSNPKKLAELEISEQETVIFYQIAAPEAALLADELFDGNRFGRSPQVVCLVEEGWFERVSNQVNFGELLSEAVSYLHKVDVVAQFLPFTDALKQVAGDRVLASVDRSEFCVTGFPILVRNAESFPSASNLTAQALPAGLI